MKRYTAIDVGGSSIKYGCVLEDGSIEKKGKVSLPGDIHSFYEVIEEIVSLYEVSEGVAFSFPGAVDEKRGIIGGGSAVPYIHDFHIKGELEERTKKRISMENDANCAALAEVWMGAAKNNEDSLFLVIGSGVGGAIVKDRSIHKGSNLHGGEFGYTVVGFEGLKPVTWSDRASTRAIVEGYQRESGEVLDGIEIFKRSEAGDEGAQRVIEDFYRSLATGIFNMQYSYDPEVIVIGGGISAREDLVERVEEKLGEIMDNLPIAKVRPVVKRCEYENDANLIGAVYNYIKGEEGC